MAELLSPGVFIEEVPSNVQVIQPVSTSNMGIVGFSPRGPANVATLVTSYEQYTRVFGGLTTKSFMPMSMAAYFANGGRRAYVVRVVPADAVEADGDILTSRVDHTQNVGDGATAGVTNAALSGSALRTPVVPASLTFTWRSAGAPVAAETLKLDDGTTNMTGDGATDNFSGRINPASLPTVDQRHFVVDPGSATLTVDWTSTGAQSITLVPSGSVATGTNGGGSTATLDLRTGRISLACDASQTPDNATAITITYTPTTATRTLTDDGAGVLPAGTLLTGPGAVDYATGTYSFTTTVANTPHENAPILVNYSTRAWDVNPISAGEWGNSLRVDVSGSLDYFTATTASFSRYNVNVLLEDDNGVFQILESYEDLDFSTTTSSVYFADVINELSDLITVTEPASVSEGPRALNGTLRTENIGAGAGASKTLSITLERAAIAPRTVTITWTDNSDVARTATDNGQGLITGDVDPAGTNTIDYTTGVVAFTTVGTVKAGTLISCTYYSAASASTTETTFSGGDDGTFDTTNYGRSQFTSPVLETGSEGLYALNRVEELMQVVVPDFAGDVTITRDILDYVDGRGDLPSGGDRFAILTVPVGSSAQEASDWFRFNLVRFSKYGALYWPWVRVADPLANDRPTTMPPLAHIAGVYARTDSTRNVGKAPGGTVDGALRFLVELESVPTQGERDLVYQNKINPLISSPQTGLAVWGVRTIASESEWRYINARRLFMFLERAVYNSTHWIAFENNGPALWARIKAQVQGFMTALYNEGLFAGSSPAEAFFVRVDETNNSAETIEQGQVIIDVGAAPNRPAEFVRFRFTQSVLG